jgi:hypothetical protein
MKKIFIITVLMTSYLFADEAKLPTFPECSKQPLFGEKSVKEFFETRLKNAEGQAKLQAKRKSFEEARTKVIELVKKDSSNDEIVAAATEMEDAKDEWLKVSKDFGPCAVNSTNGPLKIKNEIWYESDGSCYFNSESNTNAFNRESIMDGDNFFKSARELILSTETYEKKFNDKEKTLEGFSHVLLFKSVDPKTGKASGVKNFDGKLPFMTFIAALGPELFSKTSLSYLIENFQGKDDDTKDKFALKFKGVPAPEGFKAGSGDFKVYDTDVAGKKSPTLNYNLVTNPESNPQVIGQWCIEKNGHFRYSTAANLKLLTLVVDDATLKGYSEKVLLGTLMQFYEKTLAKGDGH